MLVLETSIFQTNKFRENEIQDSWTISGGLNIRTKQRIAQHKKSVALSSTLNSPMSAKGKLVLKPDIKHLD